VYGTISLTYTVEDSVYRLVRSAGLKDFHTDKKENQLFLYKKIQNVAVEKSYVRKGFLIYEEMCKYLAIYEEAVSHI
jgi:hypothetical protein